LNEQWVSEKIRGGNEKIPRIQWKWTHNLLEPLGHGKDSTKRKIYSYEHLHLKNQRDLKELI
jgi:hypothetical protein